VLDADTRQPISDVQVRRFNPTAQATYDEATKGGQRLDPARGVRTDQEGRFVLDAERDLTLLQQQVWFSVTVSFQHEGCQTLRTNFSLAWRWTLDCHQETLSACALQPFQGLAQDLLCDFRNLAGIQNAEEFQIVTRALSRPSSLRSPQYRVVSSTTRSNRCSAF
jgi:hypothetical protein